MIAELDQQKLPDQLKFFEGDRSEKDLLLQKMWRNIGSLFLDYLSSNYDEELLHKNKLKIHLKMDKFFMIILTLEKTVTTFLVIKKMKPRKLST